MRRLEGSEIGKVSTILQQRFNLLSIRSFTRKRLNIDYDDQVSPLAGKQEGIFQFVDYLNRNWKHYTLINAYLADYPDDPDMLKFAAELGVQSSFSNPEGTGVVGLSALEQLVNAGPFMDVDVLLRGISRVERTICRIEVVMKDGRKGWGTGFLIGEDLLMSNYHVFKPLIVTPDKVETVNCLFDYKVSPDGTEIYPGSVVGLADNAVVCFSEVGALDATGSADLNADWEADKLDYAIVKLAKKVGKEAFGPGQSAADDMEKRGWLTFPNPSPAIYSGSHAIIIQHPQKGPKKIAFGFEKVEGMDDSALRVRYKINTQKGSSGSPCFNHKFELIALHNMGDPNHNPSYNQGIPIARIREDLVTKGFEITQG